MGKIRDVDTYKRAIDHFGPQMQINKAKEECTEFILACLQFEQGRIPIQKVIEEAADVIITIGQARLILGYDAVDSMKRKKLSRLAERISMEKAEIKRRVV